jgi:D-alanine-D-alanine ligase
MDKVLFKEAMTVAGLPQVDYVELRDGEWPAGRERVEALGLPVFVKPAQLGSSVGIARVSSWDELDDALAIAFRHDPLVIVEAGASGLEIECAVIGNAHPIASEVGQIVLTSGDGWYDYEAKYTPGGMELIVPAPIDVTVAERVRALAVEVFRRSRCEGLARVDFFVEGEAVLVNELNTIPGFTPTSVFARLFEASGVSYRELLDRLLGYAVERHERELAYQR